MIWCRQLRLRKVMCVLLIINIKHEISLFYSISRKPTLRIAKIEGIAYIVSHLIFKAGLWPAQRSCLILCWACHESAYFIIIYLRQVLNNLVCISCKACASIYECSHLFLLQNSGTATRPRPLARWARGRSIWSLWWKGNFSRKKKKKKNRFVNFDSE